MTHGSESIPTIFIDTDCLIDRQCLAQMLPDAFATTLSARFGQDVSRWRDAYRRVQADWDNYWADLNLSEDDSVAQWREGRWRIVRALYRLVNLPLPNNDQIPFFLDELPRDLGRLCPCWRDGALQALGGLTCEAACVLLSPYQPAGLISGMLDAAQVAGDLRGDLRVLGPDELEQVGLDGLDPRVLLMKAKAESVLLVSNTKIDDVHSILPPPDLTTLPSLLLPK